MKSLPTLPPSGLEPCDMRLVSGIHPNPRWIGPALLSILLLFQAGSDPTITFGASTSARVEEDEKPRTVHLIVDYSDGCQKHFPSLAWREGMTVLDALKAAQAHPRGIRFEATGAGEAAFLNSIDGLANEGGGSGKRNWLFEVNGKLGNRSCGNFVLQASDTVKWMFGKPRTRFEGD